MASSNNSFAVARKIWLLDMDPGEKTPSALHNDLGQAPFFLDT